VCVCVCVCVGVCVCVFMCVCVCVCVCVCCVCCVENKTFAHTRLEALLLYSRIGSTVLYSLCSTAEVKVIRILHSKAAVVAC
jgi:hypothetical protein